MRNFKKNKALVRVVCLYVVLSFFGTSTLPSYAQNLTLPAPNQFVPLSAPYSFPVLKGMKFDAAQPFEMKFIIDTGDDKAVTREEASWLIRYFLAGLTIPEDELWVNMSPYEKDKMITSTLAETDLGKDLLSQDYILKQISASLTYPESDTGKDFWQKTYEKVFEVAKTTNLPVNTFNKIWIVPDKAVVYENEQIALITEATLRVMLEEDYLALKQNASDIQRQKKNLKADTIEQINQVSSKVMREVILPKINQDVNSGRNFATLRQIYYSLILATWFKEKFKDSIYKYYIDKGKTKGIDLAEKDAKDKIYNLYVEAFTKGIYNYIKTDTEPKTRRIIKRQYFSGGFSAKSPDGKFIDERPPLTEENWPKAANLAGINEGIDVQMPVKIDTIGSSPLEKDKGYASWGEFEEKELVGKEILQKKRNLSKPVRIAFNIDTFADDENVMLFAGINRVFDNIFRLLDGNPNFAPLAIFLGKYKQDTPSNRERLAEFLNSNPAFGNSRYTVKLQGNKLIINGKGIVLYNDLATSEELKELGIDFLLEMTRQRYLEIRSSEAEKKENKQKEEQLQAERIENYLNSLQQLKVIIIAPEEDKGEVLGDSIVNRINTKRVLTPDSRKIVVAEPVTAVTSIMNKIMEDVLKPQNSNIKISVVDVAVSRTDRQGNRLINLLETRPGLALNKVLGRPELDVASHVSDTGVISGANTIQMMLRIDGFIDDLTPGMINDAFREASRGALKGMIDYKEEPTTSGFEMFNQNQLIFMPVKIEDIKKVAQLKAAPYRTVMLRGYFSETGYAKQILDLMTELSMFEGNKAMPQERVSLEAPEGSIPSTPDKLRLQVPPDAEPIPLVQNSARGRMAISGYRILWDNPNFELVGINGVRSKAEAKDITAKFIEFDEVFGQAPFTVEVTGDGRHFKFTDREERIIKINRDISSITEPTIRTPYGNLYIEQEAGKIKLMRLHGEEVYKTSVVDNKDGTFSAEGALKNGTTVRLTYSYKENEPFVHLIFVGVKKKAIIPFTNIRADESTYKQAKGESDAAFLERVEKENRELAERILVEMPWLNKRTQFWEASGELLERGKVAPFLMAGAGASIFFTPAKKDIPTDKPAADATVVPGVNTELFLSTWDLLETLSCASCSTNAAALGAKALLYIISIAAGYFDIVHAITNTQGRQFGEILKGITRSVDARGNISYESTGAATELGRAIAQLLNTVSGVALRVGNDDGSLVRHTFQVIPRTGGSIATAEEINTAVKKLTETPEKEGGLKGFLGYGVHKTSLEIIGSELGGIFDPSQTRVNHQTGSVSTSVWFDNERGYVNQASMLGLLKGLHQAELERRTEIVTQDVVPHRGLYTGRVSVASAKQSGATGVIMGSGQFRGFEEIRSKPEEINREINQSLNKALEEGVDLPILNIYLNEADQVSGMVDAAINKQISGALKGLYAKDIINIIVSLEVANEEKATVNNYLEYLEMTRRTIRGYVETLSKSENVQKKEEYIRKRGEIGYNDYLAQLKKIVGGTTEKEILENYAKSLGANVASKVRFILKFNSPKKSDDDIIALTNQLAVDGIILPPQISLKKVTSIVQDMNKQINKNPEKREELKKRLVPRFFICVNAGASILDDTDISTLINLDVNHYNIQLAIAPTLPQINELSLIQKGEKLSKGIPPANKVPLRILLQNATLEKYKEGFVNLDDAATGLGIHDVLIAHSEQTKLTRMTDAQWAELAIRFHQLKEEGKITGRPFVCVGETLADYQAGRAREIVTTQTINRLKGLTPEQVADTDIVYEAGWLIGTDIDLTPILAQIQEMHQAVRNTIKSKYGLQVSEKIGILYGGNFNLDNAKPILKLKDVDGALIGRASKDPTVFRAMVSIAEDLADSKNSGRRFYKKIRMRSNLKTEEVPDGYYEEIVSLCTNVDRRKVEVGLGPGLNNIPKLAAVYTKAPLKDIVVVNQLNPITEIKDRIFFERVDFNVPLDYAKALPEKPSTWEITSYARIKAALPDINLITENGGIVVLVSHFEPKEGRFKDVKNPPSLSFLVPTLEEYLGKKVTFVDDIVGKAGPARQNALRNAKPGEVILFENVRFHKDIATAEMADKDTPEDIATRNKLASQLYAGANPANPTVGVGGIVNSGFGVMHRRQASVTGVVAGVPRIAGISMAEELTFGMEAIRNARPPVAVVLGGGAKIGEKIPMLKNIILNKLTPADKLFIYGAAAIPFLMVKDPGGFEPGKSRDLVDDAILQAAADIIELVEEEDVEIILPEDFVVADELPSDVTQRVFTTTVLRNNIPASKGAYDIGPKTVERFREEVFDANGKSKFGTIIVNGPPGAFDKSEQFITGTQGIFDIIAEVTKTEANPEGATTIFGGGDTGYAAEVTGVAERVSFVSDGGGAFLELLAGKDLPGAKVLRGKAGIYSYHLNPNIEEGFDRIRGLVSDYAAQNVDGGAASPLTQQSDGATASSAVTNAPQTTGGIDLQGIKVGATPTSIPVNLPRFDFENLEGLTFQIIRIEAIPNLNAFFGIVAGEKEEKKDKLAYLKN